MGPQENGLRKLPLHVVDSVGCDDPGAGAGAGVRAGVGTVARTGTRAEARAEARAEPRAKARAGLRAWRSKLMVIMWLSNLRGRGAKSGAGPPLRTTSRRPETSRSPSSSRGSIRSCRSIRPSSICFLLGRREGSCARHGTSIRCSLRHVCTQ